MAGSAGAAGRWDSSPHSWTAGRMVGLAQAADYAAAPTPAFRVKIEALAERGLNFGLSDQIRVNPWRKKELSFRWCCILFGVLAAEALHPSGGIDQLLLTGKERMAIRADFYADVSLMGRPGHKRVAACAVHAHFMVRGMNSCLHNGSHSGIQA